jgi:ADP-heptose:LPS heptosyltransferase
MQSSKKILVFRTGQLGDTLACLPALWVIREYFHKAHITILYDFNVGKKFVQVSQVLENSGVADSFLSYRRDDSLLGKLLALPRLLALLLRLRVQGFDTLVYLVPSTRESLRAKRDILFFRLAGIRNTIATDGFEPLPQKVECCPLPVVSQESERLLSRLAKSGIPIPAPGCGRMDLNIKKDEKIFVDQWLKNQPSDGGRRWLAVGPGSKMPVKIWSAERYAEVVGRLIGEYDIWPVVFGGPEDKMLGESLVRQWGRGYVAAGSLNVRKAVAAMERCVFYLGNDTGTMHMAVAAGLKCVAIFSSRQHPGIWYPYGKGHIVLRTPVSCEGCKLVECIKFKKKCILSISTDEVYLACKKILCLNKLY